MFWPFLTDKYEILPSHLEKLPAPGPKKSGGGDGIKKTYLGVGRGLWITYRLAKTRILDKNSTTQTQDNQYKNLKNQK